jgi:hypothetical protein
MIIFLLRYIMNKDLFFTELSISLYNSAQLNKLSDSEIELLRHIYKDELEQKFGILTSQKFTLEDAIDFKIESVGPMFIDTRPGLARFFAINPTDFSQVRSFFTFDTLEGELRIFWLRPTGNPDYPCWPERYVRIGSRLKFVAGDGYNADLNPSIKHSCRAVQTQHGWLLESDADGSGKYETKLGIQYR